MPALREVLLKDVPVPIWPSRLDDHTREPLIRAPPSASVPVPLKEMLIEGRKVEPSVGLIISAVGDEDGGGGATPVANFQKSVVLPPRRA